MLVGTFEFPIHSFIIFKHQQSLHLCGVPVPLAFELVTFRFDISRAVIKIDLVSSKRCPVGASCMITLQLPYMKCIPGVPARPR